jgi:hypothetical protein
LIGPAVDPAAAKRIETSPNIAEVLATAAGPDRLNITAELIEPATEAVDLSLSLESPANTAGTTAPLALFLPAQDVGSEAFLLVHREIEGELQLVTTPAIQLIEPLQVPWPANELVVAPADFVARIASPPSAPPLVTITRHERSQTLRAIVEVLRQRSVISPDGTIRTEIEIVVQNHSEQYLKLELPYSRRMATVYEVQVAGRNVGVSYGTEAGHEVLLIPLLRTGLLEPELTVHVAYVAHSDQPLLGSGKFTQKLPTVLGGIPVAQSALVLLLPEDFDYTSFGGTLDRVELIDIEVGEMLRRSRRIEQISEKALYSKGAAKVAALSKLVGLKEELASELSSTKQQTEANVRLQGKIAERRDEAVNRRLEDERHESIKKAEQSQRNLFSNVEQLGRVLSEPGQKQGPAATSSTVQALQQPAIPPAVPAALAAAPIQFPRVGKIFVFRQLQGAGFVEFSYRSHEARQRLYDVIFAAVVIALVLIAVRFASFFLRPARRLLVTCAVFFLLLIIFRIGLDIAIPGFALLALILLMKRPNQEVGEHAHPMTEAR